MTLCVKNWIINVSKFREPKKKLWTNLLSPPVWVIEWLFCANTLGRTNIPVEMSVKWSQQFSNKEKITVDGAAASLISLRRCVWVLIIQQTHIHKCTHFLLSLSHSAAPLCAPVLSRWSSPCVFSTFSSPPAYNYCYYDADAGLKREIIASLAKGVQRARRFKTLCRWCRAPMREEDEERAEEASLFGAVIKLSPRQ